MPGDLYHFLNNNENEIVIKINGKEKKYPLEKGYFIVERKWKDGDVVEMEIPMPVRKVIAHKKVEADRGKVAIQKGPVVYCAEGIDHKDNNALNLVYDPETGLNSEYRADLLNGVQVITGEAKVPKQPLTLIPYHVWANRGRGEMVVWLPTTKE